MDSSQAMQQRWKTIFLILSAIILVIMPVLSHCYGQTGDEWLQMEYGKDIWNYFFNNNPQALDYSAGNTQHLGQELYGGLYDFGTEVLHHWFPSINQLSLRHFINALCGAVFMIFTGLLAFRLSKKWSVAVIALLFMFFSPRIFGESMNNPKDIPFAAGFIVGVYFLLAILQGFPRKMWLHTIGLALGFGLAFGVRSAGGALQIAYFIVLLAGYYLMDKTFRERIKADNKLMKKMLLFIGIGIFVGYLIGLSCWPYGLQSPIAHPLESLKGMTNRETNVRVLFEGKYYQAHYMPKYYEFKWLFISNPLIIVAGFLLFVVMAFYMSKLIGRLPVLFLFFGALFPILYMIYKDSTVYDTWRHIFFVYPFWVIAATFGWWQLGEFITEKMAKKQDTSDGPKERYLWQIICVIGLLPAVVWTITSHPNQYIYFNELTGGVKGALGKYDLDYYQNASLQAADWIKKNVKKVPGRKLVLVSNMSGFYNYFSDDTAGVTNPYVPYRMRHSKDWDYFVVSQRFLPIEQIEQGIWPPQHVVHTVRVNGVPLLSIIRQASKDGIAGNKAIEAQDFPTAVTYYENYLRADTSDEYAYFNYANALAATNQLNVAITAMEHATRLQSSNPQFWDFLSKLYNATGNQPKAQEAQNRAQEIAAAEAELVPAEE